MMSLWDALRMNMMISYQELVRTFLNLQVGSQKLGNAMAAPRVNSQIPLPSGVQGKLKFQTVNDYGSVTPVREVNLN
ncbi:hypothetical protein ESCOMMO153M_19995 [Escherichia coli]